MKLSSVYTTDMTFDDVVEQINALNESNKQTNANFKCMSKEIEELKEQVSHLSHSIDA